MDKKVARLAVTERVSALQDLDGRSAKIVDILMNLPEIKTCESLAVYFALSNEVNVDSLISRAIEMGKSVFAPKCHGDNMTFYKVKSVSDVRAGYFGVREPVGNEETDKIDVIIVPMVAFDDELNRLGHGKGYYDRFLFGKEALKIGVAFEAQREDFLSEKHDMKMDIIVTEEGVLR